MIFFINQLLELVDYCVTCCHWTHHGKPDIARDQLRQTRGTSHDADSKTKKPVVKTEAAKPEAAKSDASEPKASKPKAVEAKAFKPEATEGLSWLVWQKSGRWVGEMVQSLPPHQIGANNRRHNKMIEVR